MAAADPVKDLKERATCPICLELFRDAVMTECGHSFCEECIARHCQGDGDVACPQCRKKFQKENLRSNWELRNMVESLPPLLRSQTGGEPRGGDTCERHQEPLKLYCKEDQTPICVVCERSQAHRGHTVVPVEEAVQEYRETIRTHLAGIESTYKSLHPLVSLDRKHLFPSSGEEEHKRLKRLADDTATLWKVHTEGPRQRFEALASQPQPREPDRRDRGKGVATRSELRECQGREPGSEPAAEKQEETRSHVGHVCEESQTPKYGLDQASLDPGTHTISNTKEGAEPKVDRKSRSTSLQDLMGGAALGLAGFRQVGVSAVPERRATWDRAGPGGEAPEKQEETETRVREKAAPPSPGPRNTPQGSRDASTSGEAIRQHLEGIESGYKKLNLLVSTHWTDLSQSRQDLHQRLKRLIDIVTLLKVDTEGPRQKFADAASQPRPGHPDSGGSSPGREAAGKTESQGPAGREPGSEREHGRRQASLDPSIHTISSTREAVESKVDVKGLVSRFEKPTSAAPSEVCEGRWKDCDSPAGQGAAQTESGGDTGGGGRGSQEPKVAAAGAHRGARPSSVTLRRYISPLASWIHQQADAPSRGDSPQGQSPLSPVSSELPSGGSRQVGVSPGGRVARPPDLQGCAVEVTLDPATAHPQLILSEDRKSVRRGDIWQQLPNNPERFDTSVCVLGSKGFTSGRRYWEVEVGPREGWAVGVARDSVQRKGRIQLKPDFGIWALIAFYVSQVPRKVGVYLDYEGGEVRFYDAETMALISSRTATFTGRLVPFFRLWTVGSRLSLSLCQR